jgi:hypothetical protein
MRVGRLSHGLKWRAAALYDRLRPARYRMRDCYLRVAVAWKWRSRSKGQGRQHGLPAPLIISLTSFPARYDTLHLTLKTLMLQSVRPDQVILWIAAEHQVALTPAILALRGQGLTIASCDNRLRPHNKYIHTRRLYPEAFIATADDDTYYWPDWLAQLLADYDPAQHVIPCHRVHKVKLMPDGKPAAYRDWTWESTETIPSALIFPTGVGGVLYPPDCLPAEADDEARILALCPRADDVWLYWMAQRNGYLFRKTRPWRLLHHWRHSQKESLMWGNVVNSNGNDQQIQAMIEAYGWPPDADASQARSSHQAIAG